MAKPLKRRIDNPSDKLIARIEDAVDLGWNCWTWKKGKTKSGYGQLTIDGKKWYAHRAVYALVIGEIPKGLVLDHKCRNRWCVNPYHLEPCTSVQNMLRGETLSGINQRKTKCKRGHPFDQENTFVNVRGERVCRTCRKAYDKERSKKRRAV